MTHRFTMSGQRIVWGPGALESLSRELSRSDVSRAAIVCGPSIAEHPDALDRVIAAAGGRIATTVAEVRAGSPRAAVEKVSRLLGEHRADGVIAIGGGSAIVTARAASILLAEGGRLDELVTTISGDGDVTSPRLRAPKLPQVVIPTTPTTAASKAGAAVFDPLTQSRYALFDPHTRAAAIIVDITLAPAPPTVLTAAATNAYAMAVEGLLSPSASIFTDALLSEAVRSLAERLRRGDASAAAGERTMLAATMAGEGTNSAQVGLAAACSHALGMWGDHPNGSYDAAVLPYVLAHNRSASTARWATLARALDCHPDDVIDTVTATLGLPHLRDLGIARPDLDDIAGATMADFAAWQNPLPVTHADALEILNAAW